MRLFWYKSSILTRNLPFHGQAKLSKYIIRRSRFLSSDHRCKCGHCQTNLLRKEKETTCCKEIEGCTRSLQDQLVLAEVETPPECITLHPGFAAVCLNKWSLRSAAPKYRTIEGIKYRQSGSEDK